MQIYLPIAEIPVNILLILLLGLATGFMAGMFGIGGGFLITPLLIFIGIPPAIAVSTSANQIIASSFSGLLTHLNRGTVDIKMGLFLLIGGLFGSAFGVYIFKILQKTGQIDVVIPLFYVIFLGSIGVIMLIDSIKILLEKHYDLVWQKKPSGKFIRFLRKIENLPGRIYFPKSNVKVSVVVPIILSFKIGILISLMGIGGGFLMIPAMIYILRMPAHIVIGTSLFQIVVIAANTTFLQAITNNTVDILLACLMIISSVFGAQIGSRVGQKTDVDNLRSLLAIIILIVCINMFIGLFIHPQNLYKIEILRN
jgi:uncharacterized membrane protein YfcA